MIDRAVAESLMAWWRESGVDLAVGELPRAWLRGDAPATAPSAAPIDLTERPKDLAAFHRWLETSKGLPLDRPGATRILPAGPEAAPLMVLGDLPDREDSGGGQPFAGEARQLLDRMLKAIGIDSGHAYHASLACFHAPGARIGRDELERCSEIARDHIRLARPDRLILFGDAPSRALIGEPLARARGENLEGGGRADHRHLPPALAAPASVRQGAGVAGPAIVDERERMTPKSNLMFLSMLFAAPLAAQSEPDPLAPLTSQSKPGAATPPASTTVTPPTVPVSPPPRVIPRDWKGVLAEIDAGNWEGTRLGIAALPDHILKPYALAELYTAKGSPKIDQASLIQLLASAPELPQAEQLSRIAAGRGSGQVPAYTYPRPILNLGAAPRRTKARPATGDVTADLIRPQLDPFVKVDDGPGAEAILTEALTTIEMPEARAELLQRVAWIYYVSGRDEDARRLAEQGRAENSGEWAGQSAWISGLASWRLRDCASAYGAFNDAARLLRDPEFQAGAYFWAARSAQACQRPAQVRGLMIAAARSSETFYGILARETLGMDHRMGRTPAPRDLGRVEALPNVRRAAELLAMGRRAQAEELLRHQARIGNPADHRALVRIADRMNLPGAQFWLAHFGPSGAQVDPADRYPTPDWVPYNGWRVDPALAYAHIIQESNFRAEAVSPAGAVGLMQVRPGTAGDTARSRGAAFSVNSLKDPLANIDYGQAFIDLIRSAAATQDQLPKVIAAYNAGPVPVARWTINDRGDPLLWMESIPYWETRYYVPTVMRNMWVIQSLLGEPSPTLTALAQHKWPAFPAAVVRFVLDMFL